MSIIDCNSRKCPFSIILSASSSTKNDNECNSTTCFSPPDISSHNLPGVPTTISGLNFNSLSCFSVDIPPTMGTTLMLISLAASLR
uniref:Uncharacterized protein MANES_15G047300 n=1 Tax=Rhizophora mucronata TaxID=61149 RepID=A0A2P2LUB8_RHIMU